MVDRIGMCTICAKVCHKGHDISYAKYGSFFCDCGAKEDGSCKALTKRATASYSAVAAANNKQSPSKPTKSTNNNNTIINNNGNKLKRNKLASSSSTTTIKFDSNLKLAEEEANDGKELDSLMLLSSSLLGPRLSTIEILKRLMGQIKANKPKQLEKLRPQILEAAKSRNLLKTMRHLIEEILVPVAHKCYDNSVLTTNTLLARYFYVFLALQGI